jgi:isopenicillin N synthase-like dioxygenase
MPLRSFDVPVVDVADLERDSRARRVLDRACSDTGFFRIRGHGIPSVQFGETLNWMRRFFELPPACKRRVERSADNPWGFYDRELTKQRRDAKEIFDFGSPDASGPFSARPRFPAELPGFEAAMWKWFAACEAASYRLLAGIALNLGAAPEALHGAFGAEHTSFLRLNQYPLTDDVDALGVHHHTDAGAITLLLDDGHPGLQMQIDGTWTDIEPDTSTLLVNIGDVVQVWSNDRYRAPLHRVRASRHVVRRSAPFFFNPAYSANYAPLDATRPPRYGAINWGDFRAGRASGDYADLGEEIQISDFRITSPQSGRIPE